MKWPLLAPQAFLSHTAESFYAYIKGMMVSNVSKEVSGVSISLGKANKITIRMSREEKLVTREELSLLATEYKLNEFELLQLFIKRKIGINYDNDTIRAESDRASLANAKEDARNKRIAMRKEKSIDKLLKPKRNTRLHEKSPIQPPSESPLEQRVSSDTFRECDT